MTRQKTHEQLAMTRTKRRLAQVRKLLGDIACDWCDTEIGNLEWRTENLLQIVREFEEELAPDYAHYLERMEK